MRTVSGVLQLLMSEIILCLLPADGFAAALSPLAPGSVLPLAANLLCTIGLFKIAF